MELRNNMGSPFKTQVICGEGTNSDIDTTEEDIVTITDLGDLKVNELSMYFDTTLGTHTALDYRFYYQNEKDGSWFQVAQHNLSTGEMEDYVLTAVAGMTDFIFEMRLASCFGFKVTGQGVGGSNGASNVKVLGRYA